MDSPDTAFDADAALRNRSPRSDGINPHPANSSEGHRISDNPKGGVSVSSTLTASEASPLLDHVWEEDSQDGEDSAGHSSSSPKLYDFGHLPWHRRPSVWWVLAPFFLVACAYGGILTPKTNLFLELICREYYSELAMRDPTIIHVPIDFNDGSNSQCRIPEVSSRVTQFALWGNVICGLLAAFMSPRLGALSDRVGRKAVLVLTSSGTILGELIIIAAASYPETFPVWVLYFSFIFDGITGTFLVAMAMANSYATDCTPPAKRNVVFAWFHCCLFSGIAIGPILAGYIVKATGRIVVVFYILTAVHLFFASFLLFVVPESLSAERRSAAWEKHRTMQKEFGTSYEWKPSLRALNFAGGLKILWPTGPGTTSALRRNLVVLAIVDTVCFGVAMGSMQVVIIYTNYAFGWGSFESGRFLSIVNSCRVFALVVVLPLCVRLVRGPQSSAALLRQKNTGADMFDIIVIRLAIIIDTLGYVGYSLAEVGEAFILSGSIAAFGGVGSPTLQAALTKHVAPEDTGRLLGAIGLLHALARVVAPTIFSGIYSATVGKYTRAVFVCLAATFGFAFVMSWFVRPHVYTSHESAVTDDESSRPEANETSS